MSELLEQRTIVEARKMMMKIHAQYFFQGVKSVISGSGRQFQDGRQYLEKIHQEPEYKRILLQEYDRLVQKEEEEV